MGEVIDLHRRKRPRGGGPIKRRGVVSIGFELEGSTMAELQSQIDALELRALMAVWDAAPVSETGWYFPEVEA